VAIIYAASHGRRDPGGKDWHEMGWFDKRISVNPDGSIFDWHKVGSWETFGRICTAIYAGLWAYAGWDKVPTIPHQSSYASASN
jgi:L-type amino acid transporter 9